MGYRRLIDRSTQCSDVWECSRLKTTTKTTKSKKGENLISRRLRCNKEFDVIKEKEERESKYAKIFENKAVYMTQVAPSRP